MSAEAGKPDVVVAWRFRLALFSPIAAILGILSVVYIFVLEVAPYPKCFPDCPPDQSWSPYPYLAIGAPLLLILAGAALVVRWWMPIIAVRPPGLRTKPVIVLTVILLISGAVEYLLLGVILVIAVAVTGCNVHGC